MPQLLRDVLCVIETFHKYARKDGGEVALTCRELKRLIQSEFGDILQPRVSHAVERNLNLLALDSDGTISFNEFVLTIFNLLNLHYLDIQSLLNPEPRQESKPEEKPDDMEAHETVVQEESEKKTQPPALEDEAQDGKYQESSKERDAEEGSKIQELRSEEDQNHPEIEGTVTPGEEARDTEEGTAETLVRNKSAPAAEGASGARERVWELSPLESQSGGENKRVTKTHDKPVKEDDGNQGEDPEPTVTENDKRSSETPISLTPDDGDSSSGKSDLLLQDDSQSQVDSLRESAQGSHHNPNTQKQVALGKKNRTQEAAGGEDEQLKKEQEQPEGEERKIQGSAMKGPGPAVEPSGHPEAQTHLETEKLVTWEEEDKNSQELAGEVDDQQNPAKKEHDSSILQSGLEKRSQRD